MGGSGNSSPNRSKGVKITFKDGTTQGFRVNDKGVILDLNSRTPVEGLQGQSIKTIIDNAKKNGLGVEIFNKRQLADIDKANKEARETLENDLNSGGTSQTMREASRKRRVKVYRGGAVFS